MRKKRERRAREAGRGGVFRDEPPRPPRRSIAGRAVAVVIGVLAVGLILVALDVIPRWPGKSAGPLPRVAPATAGPADGGSGSGSRSTGPARVATEPLSWANTSSGEPINRIAPTSGKPISPGVVSSYKGYTVGHCCETSRREWEALSESQKDADVRRFLQ
jgi:hypothetical protein